MSNIDNKEKKLPERLRALRKEKKWTQEELGARVGMYKSTISYYESGRREPDLDALQQFADIFDVSVDYLLGRTDKPHAFTQEEKDFMSDMDSLALEDLMEKYPLTIGDRPATKAEVEEAIKYIKMRRIMDMM